jgi:hypothetical protein
MRVRLVLLMVLVTNKKGTTMCKQLYVDAPYYYGPKDVMDKAGLKFDPKKDRLFCKALSEAWKKAWDAYFEQHPEDIPF